MPESPRRPLKAAASRSSNSSQENPVVAELEQDEATKQHTAVPFSSLALSPSRAYAVTARKDTLLLIKVGPHVGIQPFKSIPIAQLFQTNVQQGQAASATSSATSSSSVNNNNAVLVRDAFRLGQRTGASQAASNVNVILTDVAWSIPQETQRDSNDSNDNTMDSASFIAAAGSNGVIVVWSADTLLLKNQTTGLHNNSFPAPDAVLTQHVRAVNRLAWHPTKTGLLLSASHDGKVLLWERRKVVANANATGATNAGQEQQDLKLKQSIKHGFSLFGKSTAALPKRSLYSWHRRATFDPKSEAVRDIRWSPFYEDVFALVTSSGSLIAYNRHVPPRALVKITAHSGESTSLDWHPTLPYIVATGGASDRSVKVWDLESHLNLKKDDCHMAGNYNTNTSAVTDASNESDPSNHSFTMGSMSSSLNLQQSGRTMSSQSTLTGSRHTKGNPKNMLHVLSISAAVTRLRWRPPAGTSSVLETEDRHQAMLAVATAPIKGASAGGSGLLALWSYHRPFMPLSVVEGHRDGAVTDFDWLDTPQPPPLVQPTAPGKSLPLKKGLALADPRRFRRGQVSDGKEASSQLRKLSTRSIGASTHDVDDILYDNSEREDVDMPVRIWQHVISVGRDGRCLLQSFARGDRPILAVPPSCFAMANLSPFQKGYGSLQVFSVCQTIPSGPEGSFLLTGLRKDSYTARAPGVFCEQPSEAGPEGFDTSSLNQYSTGKRLPSNVPELVFHVMDQGDLDDQSQPAVDKHKGIVIAPEVVHLSRFADSYVLYTDEKFTSRVALCRHNAGVAESLQCGHLTQMWTTVATMLESAGLDGLPQSASQPSNVMQFVILPTIKSLLEERADAGDVQTCVSLCEILEVVKADQTVQIPDLEVSLVREWYLSYIDLLRDMCLFSSATCLIRTCKDPFVAALNQQSTTIHESCPHCGRPLQADGISSGEDPTARRACKSCRRRVGLCFLCHQSVKGMYVWCPGCGHGGHLDHALQWFGGASGKPVREVCPTGCGHKCNMLQPLSAFPRTEPMNQPAHSAVQIDMLPPGFQNFG